MLVLDPKKRYTITQIKQHKWMQLDGALAKALVPSSDPELDLKPGEFSEQTLVIMQSLGIDQRKTLEVRLPTHGFLFINVSYSESSFCLYY